MMKIWGIVTDDQGGWGLATVIEKMNYRVLFQ